MGSICIYEEHHILTKIAHVVAIIIGKRNSEALHERAVLSILQVHFLYECKGSEVVRVGDNTYLEFLKIGRITLRSRSIEHYLIVLNRVNYKTREDSIVVVAKNLLGGILLLIDIQHITKRTIVADIRLINIRCANASSIANAYLPTIECYIIIKVLKTKFLNGHW